MDTAGRHLTDADLELLGERIVETAQLIDGATHRLLTDLRQFDEVRGWRRQGAVSAAHWLSWKAGISLGPAREQVRVARALGSLPTVDEALRRGQVSFSKVRAISRVATAENQELLLGWAQAMSTSQLEKACRLYRAVGPAAATATVDGTATSERYVRMREMDDGSVRLELQLRPDELAKVMRACEVAAGTPDLADGLVAMADSLLRGESPARPAVEVMLHVDASTLTGHLEDGHGVSAETSRRVLCDAGIVPVIESAAGEVLNVQRKTRAIQGALRRALLARDGGCRFPGCGRRRWVDGHHIQHWADGGETKLSNLVLLCGRHHTVVHEDGFSVELSDGMVTFFNPQGRPVPEAAHRSPFHEPATDTLYDLLGADA